MADAEPRISVPEDLAAALARDEEARRAFERLPFPHRREYVEGVEEAKRPETRVRRVAATLERVRDRRASG